MKTFPRLSSRSAFTIVELLVAISITAVMVTLMLNITVNVMNAWTRSSGTLSAGNQARLILDQVSQDLQGAILRRDGNVWLVATLQRDQAGNGDANLASTYFSDWPASSKPGAGTLPSVERASVSDDSLWIDSATDTTPLELEDYRFGQAGVWLRLFTIPPDAASTDPTQRSAPRAVGYQIVRASIGATTTQPGYLLFRSEVRPSSTTTPAPTNNSTFAVGYDLLMPLGTGNPPSYNFGDGVEANAGNIRRPSGAQVIGNNIVDFGVRFYERTSAGALVEVFPVNRRDSQAPSSVDEGDTFAATTNPGAGLADYGTNVTGRGFPAVAEVMVRILTEDGVRQLAAYEEDNTRFPGQTWWSIVLANSKVFTRRIELPAAF